VLKSRHLAILTFVVSFASVTGLLFTPALPSLGKDLGISENMAEWTISIFLVGYSLGQLPYGPIANRFGRKPALYIGTTLALLGSILAYAANSFGVLAAARFLQALGSAVGLKASFTMISDFHEGPQATESIALHSLAFGITPGLAIAAGGFITASFGWKGCFLFLIFYSLLIGLLAFFLPETARRLDPHALQVKNVIQGYRSQFKNPKLILYSLIVTSCTSIFYIFAALSPYIGMDRAGLSPAGFGLWNLVPAAGMVAGALAARGVAKTSPFRRTIWLGIGLAGAGAFAMGVFFLIEISAPGMFLTQAAIQAGMSLVWSNANAQALGASSDKSNASAVIQFINIGGACVSSFLASFIPGAPPLLLPASTIILLITMACLFKKIQET